MPERMTKEELAGIGIRNQAVCSTTATDSLHPAQKDRAALLSELAAVTAELETAKQERDRAAKALKGICDSAEPADEVPHMQRAYLIDADLIDAARKGKE